MKHYALNATFLVASACILGGCAGDDNPWQSSTDGGSLRLSLSADGNIAASTRADDTKATIIPAAADFGVSLSRTDGSFNKKWNLLEEFNKEELFPIGEYKIEAFTAIAMWKVSRILGSMLRTMWLLLRATRRMCRLPQPSPTQW